MYKRQNPFKAHVCVAWSRWRENNVEALWQKGYLERLLPINGKDATIEAEDETQRRFAEKGKPQVGPEHVLYLYATYFIYLILI